MTGPRILNTAFAGILGLILQIGIPASAVAQTTSETDSLIVLPPLELVLAQSRAYAPHIEERRVIMRRNEQVVDRASKMWLSGISLGVQSTAGTYGNDTIDQISVGATAGAAIRFSLFDLFAQRDERKILRLELDASRETIRQAEVEEAELVVGLYQLAENGQRQVSIRAESWRSAQIHLRMAELEFTNGNLSVSELARVSSIEANAHSTYLAAVSEFKSAYHQLEIRIGTSLSSLLEPHSSKP